MENNPEGEQSPLAQGWRERLAADINALAADERRAWGSIDEVLSARYLAGICTPAEKARVEEAMEKHPDLRESIDGVREAMAQQEVAAGDTGQETDRKGLRPGRGGTGPAANR